MEPEIKSDKAGLEPDLFKREKEGHFILIKGRCH
jgi:hypothetical protein